MTICILLSAFRPCNIIRKSLALGRILTLSGACLYDTYKKRFAYIRGGGDLTICILLPAPPPSATRTKISCSRARFTLSGACLYDTYKKRFAYIRGGDLTICILLAAYRRPQLEQKSLALGRALPSRTLAFLTLIKRCSYISAAAICQYVYYRLCVARAKASKRIALRLVRIIPVRHKIIFRDGHKI